MRQAVPGGEGSKALAIIAAHTASGAEPQMPLPILNDRPHLILWQAVFLSKTGKRLSVIATDATHGAKPQITLSILKD